MNITKTTVSALFAVAAISAFAATTPEVTAVSMSQASDSRLVTITYTLGEAPAVVTLDGDAPSANGEITIREGKFHQIKRMFHACGSEIVSLERIRFGTLTLDPALPRGGWRPLTEEEESLLLADVPRNDG